MTSKVVYRGSLRTEAIHLASNQKIVTDAPIDNHGKGAAFSPTDLVATSLASCMMTIMGIIAERNDIDIENATAEVEKVMGDKPRRIVEIVVKIEFSKTADSKTKKIIEKTALKCPVGKSLHPDIKQNISFMWPN